MLSFENVLIRCWSSVCAEGMITNDCVSLGKEDLMYPMLLLCLHRLPPLVITGIDCQGLRASRRPEKYTMRMLVHSLQYARPADLKEGETPRAGPDDTPR